MSTGFDAPDGGSPTAGAVPGATRRWQHSSLPTQVFVGLGLGFLVCLLFGWGGVLDPKCSFGASCTGEEMLRSHGSPAPATAKPGFFTLQLLHVLNFWPFNQISKLQKKVKRGLCEPFLQAYMHKHTCGVCLAKIGFQKDLWPSQ